MSIFDLNSALMTIEQLGFFNVPHLLRHGSTVYSGHLRGPVTESMAVELSLHNCKMYNVSMYSALIVIF